MIYHVAMSIAADMATRPRHPFFAFVFAGVVLCLVFSSSPLLAQPEGNRVIPFTQEDRDRLLRLEEGQRFLQQQITDLKTDTRQQIADLKADTQRQIADLRNLIYVVLGGMIGLLAGMVGMVGFVIWDRRTAIAPVARGHQDLAEREALVEEALAEYAKGEPRLGEILRSFRLIH